MTRPLPGPPERPRPPRRRSSPSLIAFGALIAVGSIVSACIGGEAVNPPASVAPAVSASPSPSSSASASAAVSIAPSATPVPTATPTPTPTSTEDPSSSDATADVCAGNADNRAFFADAAETLDWPVYCPVLPAGWNVIDGTYRTAGGGRVEIIYRGRAGATLTLRQGAFCGSADGCVPPGTDSGDAPFGDQTGTFVTLDDGGYAIVVDRGANPSWLVVGDGMDEPTFRTFAADLARLD